MSVPIQISSIDSQRIKALLDAMPESNSPTIAALRNELDRATVVEPNEVSPEVVSMNSTVRFLVQPSRKTFELRLVYPQDAADHVTDVISITSPVGTALLGLAVGQTIEWPLPGGHTTRVKVVEVVYQPEREGRYNL